MFARLIINPISGPSRRGRGVDRAALARQVFARLGVDGDIRLTERAGHAHELALEAVSAAAALVVAWGGDGTVNEVARALVQPLAVGDISRPALGIVPGGSGNGLARELKIPFDPPAALERALTGQPRVIDAGELGGRLFVNVAGVGIDAHVAALVSTRVHHRGFVPYLVAAANDLMRYPATAYVLETDDGRIDAPALLIAAANSRQYGFNASIAPQASLDDGLIDLVVVEDRGVLGNLARVPAMFAGTLHRRSGVRVLQVREAVIRSPSPMLFHVDGEAVQGSDSLSVRARPGALRIAGA